MRQPYRLESVSLHEVGVFDDVRIDFKPIESEEQDASKAEIHLFTGANGCGKSTVLYALAEIFYPLQQAGLAKRRFRGETSRVDFQFAGGAGVYAIKPVNSPNVYGNFLAFGGNYHEGDFFGIDYGEGRGALMSYKQHVSSYQSQNRYSQLQVELAAFAYSGQRTLQQVPLTAIQQINNSPFENALSFDQSVRPQVLLQWIANNRAQSALAKADGDTREASIYDQALKRITDFIQEVCGLGIEFRLERSPLAVSLRVNGDSIQFDGLPDGLKSIISWVADLSLRLEAIPWQNEGDVFAQPIILFLDEIDIHLHPKWQRRILPAVQKLLPNAQIFASTHSPFVVGSVEDAWVYRLPEPKQGHTSGIVEGIPSAAGKSYRLILEEVFGIEDEFDVETENLFDIFYRERETVLKTRTGIDKLLDAARPLAARSEEASVIIDRELRQVSRLIGQEVSLA